MMGRLHSSGKYAIVGLGVVIGLNGQSERMVGVEAARRAIADAGLKREQIGGALELKSAGGAATSIGFTDAFPRILGLKNNFYFALGRGGALAALGMATAASFLERDIARYVCCVGSFSDWTNSRPSKQKGTRGALSVEKVGYWGKSVGDLRAISHHSWMAARHMAAFGTTSQQLGAIAVAQRAWACLNPEARMYGRPMTIEDHQNSSLIVEPYHLYDTCQNSDGAVAFIVTTAERASDTPKTPIAILGQGFGEISAELWWEKKNFTHMAVEPAKTQAFGQAGLTIEDLDCVQLYDCFTAEVLFQLEDYGWCKKGEGGTFVESGTTGPGGRLPVNTGGGMLSSHNFNDLTGFAEAVKQLRGECDERQIKDCQIAMTTGHGGELVSPGMCSIHSCTLLGRGV